MKEIILPSGSKATIKDGKGKDLLNAQRIAGTPEEVSFALISEMCEINGKKVVLEDVLEMNIKDVLALQMEIAGNFIPSLPGTLSTSQKPQAGDSKK